MVKQGLVEPGFLGIKAFPNGLPSFQNWWDWTLVAILAVSVVLGLFACLWYLYRSIRGLLKVSVDDKSLLHTANMACLADESR